MYRHILVRLNPYFAKRQRSGGVNYDNDETRIQGDSDADSCLKKIDHFLVLGAGASRGARANYDNAPPVGCQLANYLIGWLDSNDPGLWDDYSVSEAEDRMWPHRPPVFLEDRTRRQRLRDWLMCAQGINGQGGTQFESALKLAWDARVPSALDGLAFRVSSWASTQWLLKTMGLYRCVVEWLTRMDDQLLVDLTWLIAFAFTVGDRTFDHCEDHYDRLFRSISTNGLAVITLNYDVLAEEALRRLNTPYFYPGLRFNPHGALTFNPLTEGVPVYKIHGSCNFIAMTNISTVGNPNVPPLVLRPDHTTDTQREYAVLEGRQNLVLHLKNAYPYRFPILALYCEGKPVPANRPGVDKVRELCQSAISANNNAAVTVIGIHVPEECDDPVLYKLLCTLSKNKGARLFVNPEENECSVAQKLGYEARQCTLDGHVMSHEVNTHTTAGA